MKAVEFQVIQPFYRANIKDRLNMQLKAKKHEKIGNVQSPPPHSLPFRSERFKEYLMVDAT